MKDDAYRNWPTPLLETRLHERARAGAQQGSPRPWAAFLARHRLRCLVLAAGAGACVLLYGCIFEPHIVVTGGEATGARS